MCKETKKALLGAGSLIAMAIVLKSLAVYDFLDGDTAKRAMQVIIGIFLVVTGNAIPKAIKPLSDERCGTIDGQARRRRAGWSFVIAGLIYAIVWAVAPMGVARLVGKSAVFASLLVVAGPIIWSMITRNRTRPTAKT